MTKLLHKPGMPMIELGQWTSDQAQEPRMNTNRHESPCFLLVFIHVH